MPKSLTLGIFYPLYLISTSILSSYWVIWWYLFGTYWIWWSIDFCYLRWSIIIIMQTESIELIKCLSGTFGRVYSRIKSILHYPSCSIWGYVFSRYIFVLWEFLLYLIIIKSNIWITSHYSRFGHGTMVCVVSLATLVWYMDRYTTCSNDASSCFS